MCQRIKETPSLTLVLKNVRWDDPFTFRSSFHPRRNERIIEDKLEFLKVHLPQMRVGLIKFTSTAYRPRLVIYATQHRLWELGSSQQVSYIALMKSKPFGKRTKVDVLLWNFF